MSEEEEQIDQPAVSEQVDHMPSDHVEEQKMVPLKALQETRRKLQEAEAKAQAYHDILHKSNENVIDDREPDDPTALVEKRQLQESTALTKREILESVFQDMNPKAVQEINEFLKPILEKKPWLAASVDSAQNRYSRAYEIVQDYRHLVEGPKQPRTSGVTDGQRIVQNANKPRSPMEGGKSAQPTGAQYLKSIQGTKEFREYRQRVMRGEQ